ncbi:MAG: GIY-YIG nuclease family protein [Oscillospiraceae bacterium]|nr:GIY-YIG nuclease family protein [Oscillospiraceae bacterium]
MKKLNREIVGKSNFVYIVRCADNSLYTGWTNDLDERIRAHNSGTASKYTRARLPVALVYSEVCADKSSALKRECEIKKMKKAQKEKLVG